MSGRLWVLLFLFCLSPFATSQDGVSLTTSPAQSDGTASPQPRLAKRPPESPESRDTSGKKVGRLTLDVTVTDPAGKAVSGLNQGDFTVLDNHQPADVLSFRAVDGVAAADPVQVILLIDGVNNTFQSVATERDQIVKFLSQNAGRLPTPMSIALFSDTGVKVDQPTLDGNVLIAELKKMPIAIRTIDSAMGGEGAIERFQLSLKTLIRLLTYERTKPGRKLLIWIGPGWPMLAGVHFGASETDKHSYWDLIVTFSTDLREAGVTLYSIDSPSSGTSLSHDVFYQNFLRGVVKPKDAESGNLSLPVLAVQSGGRALYRSNDLASAIASCVDDARAYYTIVLQISPSETVNQYRPLEVKVATPALTARTNSAYYAQP